MSEQIERYFYLVLFAAIAVLGWGLWEWNQVGAYQPTMPVKATRNSFDFSRSERSFAVERYRALFNGDLFFGKVPHPPQLPSTVAPVKPKVEFVSQLVVQGITNGTNGADGYAVVGTQQSGSQTWIVKIGTQVSGETIVQIKNGYLLVRNKTGTGKVLLKN